jgi:5-methylcytosine-specific restriction enzyme A
VRLQAHPAVAYLNQHPERGLLRVRDFSGGIGGAVQALRRLGFETVTRAQLRPPGLGEEHANRTEVYEAYGGDKVAGVIRFPGEDIVNVFSDADGPYADDPPTLSKPFGYRGEGLSGPQQIRAGGNARLEQARISRSPVRFWYRPAGGRFSFLTWAAVLGRAWISGVGLNGQPRPELEWRLEAVPGPAPDQWPREVVQALEDSAITTDGGEAAAPEAQPAPPMPPCSSASTSAANHDAPTGWWCEPTTPAVPPFDGPCSSAPAVAAKARAVPACQPKPAGVANPSWMSTISRI